MITRRTVPTVMTLALALSLYAGQPANTRKSSSGRSTKASAGQAKPGTTGGSALLRSLSLHDRVAQMIVVRGYGDYPSSRDAEYKRFLRWIQQDHVGGFIVAGRIRNGTVISTQPFEMAAFINHTQRVAKTPLLVASDFERGASARVAGTPHFPYLMAFGAANDLQATKQLGADTAREARSLGVNWVFAPDADVNNNPNNPIINTRSFGENPAVVADHVGAFIEGAHEDPSQDVLVTAKHFPGHGDTAEDSHMQLAKLDKPKEILETIELTPFRAAVKHGVDAIMTAHMSVPAFDAEVKPATVSTNILTGLLRNELGFTGLVVTDALEMQAISSMYPQGEAAVRAIEAGADVLLMPIDPTTCIQAVLKAISSGRISRARINASVEKILAAKRRVGLFRPHIINLDKLSDDLDQPKAVELAQSTADQAITLVKDEKHLFPIPSTDKACLIVLGENAFTQRGETIAVTLQQGGIRDLRIYLVSPATPDKVLQAVAEDSAQCTHIYVGAFVTVGANRGSVALEGGLAPFLNRLIHGPVPVALISLGNPYLLRDFPDVSAYAATFSTSQTSEIAAAKAVLGTIPITGRMPVSIPGLAKVGDGLHVPARARVASNGSE